MDLSPKYINMCRAAEEIQKVRPKRGGDWHFDYVCSFGLHGRIVIRDTGRYWAEHVSGQDVWLPSLDGLLSMITSDLYGWDKGYTVTWRDQLEFLYGASYSLECRDAETWEQLVLCYVMDKKYGKRWDGKQWVRD